MRGPHVLMVLAFVCIVGLGFFLFVYEAPKKSSHPRNIVVDAEGQPALGSATAAVHMVIFEEPNCSHCRRYNNQIFPKIRENFIDKETLFYTSVPVSFLPHSMLIAEAWLSVYHQDKDSNSALFFIYLDAYYKAKALELDNHKDQVWDKAMLIELAKKTSSDIDIDSLKSHLEKGDLKEEVKSNTQLGNKSMQGGLMTPAIFINGVHIKEVSLEALERAISDALEKDQALEKAK